MNKPLPLSHYELTTKRGVLRVLPEFRPMTKGNTFGGVVYVADLDTKDVFPCKWSELAPKYGRGN